MPDNHPELEALAGPLKGTTIPLSADETSIGREPSNLLSILDASVSRRHCLILRENDQFKIQDLKSRNSTFVNGVPVTERTLASGDEIKIGNSLFLFVVPETGSPTGPSVEFDKDDTGGGSTIILRKQDARYLRDLEKAPPTSRTVRDLNVLLRISKAVSSVRGLEALERQVLESIFEVAPADRGAILLCDQGLDECSSVFGWDRRTGANPAVQVSRTIVSQVLEEGVAVLSNDIPAAEAFSATASIMERHIRCVLAVPLEVFDRVLGVIYLDASDPQVRFDEDHLQLLTAIGSIAASALDNARRMEWLEEENRRLQAEMNIEHNMVGESPRMRDVYQFISRVAPSDSTVLIFGESGTGKELVARAIHQNSSRTSKPFVAINCAALAETLLESELFGHEKGSFTGAAGRHIGKFEQAEGGTIFLDEIGDMPLAMQAKLLRVLEEGEIERIGGDKPITVNVRVLVATHRNLEALVRGGKFRQDLFHRIYVFPITLPPLRDRREDIPALVEHFARQICAQNNWKPITFTGDAIQGLSAYSWPGNIRELRNVVERLMLLATGDQVIAETVRLAFPSHTDVNAQNARSGSLADRVQSFERESILAELKRHNYHITNAAKALGLERSHLYKKAEQLGIDIQKQREDAARE